MKRIIVCLVLAMVVGICGCAGSGPVDTGGGRPWTGLHDPYQLKGGGGR